MGLFPKKILALSIISGLLLLFGAGCVSDEGLIWPNEPSPTPIGTILPPPVPVNFETLNAEPLVFRNKVIEVEGIFAKAAPITCIPFKGPVTDWHIIAENLEMDITGLADVAELIPERGRIKVEGVWRLYDGPLGCGKEPERGVAWYLEAIRIVEPNPLVFSPSGALVVQDGEAISQDNTSQEILINPTATPASENAPRPTSTPVAQSTQPVSSPTAINTPTVQATATLNRAAPTRTPTRAASTTAPTPTNTATPSPTPNATAGTPTDGTETATPAANAEPTNVPLPQSTTNPTEYEGPSYP